MDVYYMNSNDYGYNDNSKMMCGMFLFFIVVIILIVVICWCKKDEFTNAIGTNVETMENVLKGGLYYKHLNSNDNLQMKMEKAMEDPIMKNRKNKIAVIAVLAPWCGYCKRLKESGVLQKVAKKYPVLVIDDQHPQSGEVMKMLNSEGFPTLGIFNNGKLMPYKGDFKELM